MPWLFLLYQTDDRFFDIIFIPIIKFISSHKEKRGNMFSLSFSFKTSLSIRLPVAILGKGNKRASLCLNTVHLFYISVIDRRYVPLERDSCFLYIHAKPPETNIRLLTNKSLLQRHAALTQKKKMKRCPPIFQKDLPTHKTTPFLAFQLFPVPCNRKRQGFEKE